MTLQMFLNIIKITIFIFLTGLGTVGNTFVFVNYTYIFFRGPVKKLIHLILIHLGFINIVMLFSNGVPQTISAFGLGNFLDDTGCKIVVYLKRVARGLSICTSSLLTVVQAITISPQHFGWRRFKPRSAWHILLLFLFIWILNSLISINLLLSIPSKSKNMSQRSASDKYCYFLPRRQKINWIFLTLMALRDTVFHAAMGGTSGYMVFLLCKHHQHVHHLQNSKLLCKTPPEIKAAQSVLLLMLSFLSFFLTDCVISLYLSVSLDKYSLTVDVYEYLALGYAILSPFLLIHRDGTWLSAGMLDSSARLGPPKDCSSFKSREPCLTPAGLASKQRRGKGQSLWVSSHRLQVLLLNRAHLGGPLSFPAPGLPASGIRPMSQNWFCSLHPSVRFIHPYRKTITKTKQLKY
ncbi:LOW QUALITY PROTEIN: vomeronasal type-1 receptor 3-like [Ctenodactylus gundi]